MKAKRRSYRRRSVLQVRTVNVREQTLATLAAVGDLSYAFDIISDYLPLMHALVKKDPFSVLLLRRC